MFIPAAPAQESIADRPCSWLSSAPAFFAAQMTLRDHRLTIALFLRCPLVIPGFTLEALSDTYIQYRLPRGRRLLSSSRVLVEGTCGFFRRSKKSFP